MASSARCSYLWMLAAAACVSLVCAADCRKECALCVYRLLGAQSAFPTLTCSVECDGALDPQKLRQCQSVLLEEEEGAELPKPHQEEEEEGAESAEHQLEKKYGGFMKRYGGFMSRRSSSSSSSSSSSAPPEDEDEEENIRLQILKVLNEGTEHGGGAGDALKRYGGFMRRADGGLVEAVLGRGLKKRYGGFMRRVGRPEWLVDNSKGGGAGMKRAWEDGEMRKRYGGFMD